jgi:hypothetical protein
LLFIELIQPRAENEAESETESENDHQFGDDEIENEDKQCRKRLSRYTKTGDAKCEDAVNRLRFIKLKKLKNSTFLSRREVFFFFFFEMRTRKAMLLDRIETSEGYLTCFG